MNKANDLYLKSLSATYRKCAIDLKTIRNEFEKDNHYIINIGQARELDHKYYQVDKFAPLLWSKPFNYPKIGDIIKGAKVSTAGLLTFTIDL